MTLPTPKPPAFWDRWFDAFFDQHKRYPFWDELILAVQADARGEAEPAPMTDAEIAVASEHNRKAPQDQGPLFASTVSP